MSIFDERLRGKTPSRTRPHGNLSALRIAVFLLFGVLGAQLFNMQVLQGDAYAKRSRENYVRVESILPTRGLIYDRNGQQLVWNTPVFQAVVTPELLPEKQEDRYQVYLMLERITGTPALEIQELVDGAEEANRDYLPIAIQTYLSKAQALQLEELTGDVTGVELTVTPGRQYIEGSAFAHILGSVGPQVPENTDLYQAQGYNLNEPIGKGGVEAFYESDLRGTIGQSANEEDAYGRVITALKTRDPEPGNSLKLSIDAGLQEYTLQLLDDVRGEAQVAAAVVMNAKTGDVYALVSLPSYDNNLFSQAGPSRDGEYAELLQDKRKPFLNWALSANTPGSVFKLITAAAGLQEGTLTANSGINVTSTILEIKGENGEIYPLIDWAAHGFVNTSGAIAKSSNHFFYMALCGILGQIRGLGKDDHTSATILGDYARLFGLAAPTGIDLDAGEGSGVIPDAAWRARIHAGEEFNDEDREWFYADTCFMGIGQGDVTASPMQIARMTATVANGGRLVTPHVAKEVIATDGSVVRTIDPDDKTVPVAAEHLALIRQGMHESVTYGAGHLAASNKIDIAGKTGTAEFGPVRGNGKRDQHAWFTGFFPYDDPEFVVTVYFDLGIGGDKAAPTARKIMEYVAENVEP